MDPRVGWLALVSATSKRAATGVSTDRGRLPHCDGVEAPPRDRLHTLEALTGADQQRANLLPHGSGHQLRDAGTPGARLRAIC